MRFRMRSPSPWPCTCGRHRQRGHLAGARLGVGVERGAAEDHAVVLDHGVVADVALDLGALALAPACRRARTARSAAGCRRRRRRVASRRLSSFSSTTIVPMPSCVKTSMQQRAVDREGQDVRALDAAVGRPSRNAAGRRPVSVGWVGAGSAASRRSASASASSVSIGAVGIVAVLADARHLGQEQQLVGLQRDRRAGGHVFHRQVEGLAGGREAEGRQQHQRADVDGAADRRGVDLAHQRRCA